jgi:hypothetical protein
MWAGRDKSPKFEKTSPCRLQFHFNRLSNLGKHLEPERLPHNQEAGSPNSLSEVPGPWVWSGVSVWFAISLSASKSYQSLLVLDNADNSHHPLALGAD